MTEPVRFLSIAAIKAASRADGQQFFFPSRCGTKLIDGRFFVSSEAYPNGPRCYTVRYPYQAEGCGLTIANASKFMEFGSAAAAYAWTRRMLRTDHNTEIHAEYTNAEGYRYWSSCSCDWSSLLASVAEADALISARLHCELWAG